MSPSWKIVLDASVVHGAILQTGAGFKVYLKLLECTDKIAVSNVLVNHYREHFQKKVRKTRNPTGRILSGERYVDNWLRILLAQGKLVSVENKSIDLRTIDFKIHEKDLIVYETAWGGNCDIIITTDSRHFPIGKQVLCFLIFAPNDYIDEQKNSLASLDGKDAEHKISSPETPVKARSRYKLDN